jgi:DNA-binding response OmpR family regulator
MVTPINSASQAGTNTSPRVQFLEGLSPRLTTLRAMVDALATERTTNTVESLVRRLRAMRAAADAVGLEEIGAEFDVCAATLTNKPWSAAVRSELLDRLNVVDRLGQRAPRELELRPSGAAPRPSDQKGATPVGPFNVVALASESQKVILRQALEQADEFNLYCTQDAGEAAALLSTYDPDLFVIDGRRADVEKVIEACDGSAVMVVDARGPDVDKFREAGARWVTTIGEHYETQLLEGLRHRRRSQSMIAPRGENTVTLANFADEVAREVRQALLNTAAGSSGETPLSIGEATSVQTAVWSMLARLRETVSDLSHGAIKYDPHTPSGAMIVTGKDAMRRGGTRASAENLAGRKVLVAEDDTSVGWYLTSLLRGKGAIVVEAADGLEALRQARRDAPDLVICDVLLPALDGFALCRNLKHDVALSDVPVILLSWKEDLLQRVRELGAGADGYLAKEAEASVIVERCAEALEPRSRIEKRLLVERVVHGRLDGITPRLVLHLASRAVDNAKVVLQDAAFQYEVCLGDGRILTARRKAADGSVESGEKVLPGLLGMRAGRFTVERIREHVQAELYGSVDKVLAPYIERARRATRRLKGADLYDVSRLEIDTTALQPYLSVSPPIVNSIVERLKDGAAPGQLLHSVSASLLESVLEDLALRGGILKALDTDGDDLLDEGQRDSVAAFDVELRAGQALPVQPASGAPVIGRGSTAEDAAAAAAFAEQANGSPGAHRRSDPPSGNSPSAPPSVPPSVPPSKRPSHAPVLVAGPSRSPIRVDFEDERNSSIPPSVERSTVLGVAPEAPRPERISAMPPLPQATLTKDDEEPQGENAIPTLRPPPDDHTPPSGMKWSAPPVPRDTDFDALGGLVTTANDAARSAGEGNDGAKDKSTDDDALIRTLGGWTPVEAVKRWDG